MFRRKNFNRLFSLGVCICMLISTTPTYAMITCSEETVQMSSGESRQAEKNYLVMAKTEKQANVLEKKYDSAEVISSKSQDYLQENHMTTVTLSQQEVKELIGENDVEFVEEDVEVIASAKLERNMSKWHKKKVIETLQKESDEEWNVQMIHADKARKIIKKNRNKKKSDVKIAILDSGVDYNTDMNIAETISLVPGEEEINPLFMDASGHGTSVAGLVAAKDNEVGITGVDPYAQIYSIRVLDDDNCSPISRVIEGIYMAIDRKVDIINMSFGVNSYSKALEKAVSDALDAGILIVAAAGNSGSAEKAGVDSTVQYPAAFDGVLAVGSVDKSGEVVDSSATGSEIDLVAPGELVRSTGMFDSELVTSGTSLASPQVAGAAALIMEKDRNVSADFVRELLCESANAYGNSDEYGSGLVDVNYALEQYDSFKRNYKKKRNSIKSNSNKIMIFKNTGCVEGCWSRDNHESLIKGDYKNVKKGARFSDGTPIYYVEGVNNKKEPLYYFAGMENNPWWHGYFRKAVNGNYLCNYVATYIYETKLANEMKSNVKVNGQNGLSNSIQNEIGNDLGRIDWQREYGYVPTKGTKRAFIWGMAIHNLADAFAHSTCKKNSQNRIKHPDADNIKICPQRWNHASVAVNSSMAKYTKDGGTNGSYNEFSIVQKASEYKMINIQKNISSVKNTEEGKKYSKANINKNEKDL